MKTAKAWIRGPLPGLNEIIAAAKSGRGRSNAYSRMKKDMGGRIGEYLLKARLPTFTKPVVIHYRWFEPNKRRDPSNISSGGRKFIEDALVKSGIIKNDGWKHVQGFSDSFVVSEMPGVEIEIKEV